MPEYQAPEITDRVLENKAGGESAPRRPKPKKPKGCGLGDPGRVGVRDPGDGLARVAYKKFLGGLDI